MNAASRWVELDWSGRKVRVEYRCIEGPAASPLMVFLHEGLGSVSMWKDFPQRLCRSVGWRGLVYSRPGYGRSTPRATGEHWAADFMHRQADEVLPALLAALGLNERRSPPYWLFGHSDGASIALLHAAHFAARVDGAIVLAPHVFVEALSVDSIARAREAYLHTDLRQRLARHHDDPDSAFWGWNDIWLAPAFRGWSIEAELAAIRCPLLAVQGRDDEYGTLAQIDGVVRRVAGAERLVLDDCGHSPHRDRPDALLRAVSDFCRRATPDAARG